MFPPSHREAFQGKQAPQGFALRDMGDRLITAFPPPAASQNAARIVPGPGQRKSLRDQANKQPLEGTIAYLGNESVHPVNSWVRISQPLQLNSGAFNHPVLILARQGNAVLCTPCTSWQDKTPQQKWANAPHVLDNVLHSHMELLSESTSPRCATKQLGGLFHSGSNMEKRTFMSLQRAFWTEPQLLEEYAKGGFRQLTADSLGIACWAYTTAHEWRQRNAISEEISSVSRTPRPEPVLRGVCKPGNEEILGKLEKRVPYRVGGMCNWRAMSEGKARSEGRRRSGGFMSKASWRSPVVNVAWSYVV